MTFKLIEKQRGCAFIIKDNELSLCKTGINFSRASLSFFNKDFVEVYLDRENNRVGFKPSDDLVKGFKVDKRDTPRINCVALKDIISFGRYEFFIEEEMVVIYVKIKGVDLK